MDKRETELRYGFTVASLERLAWRAAMNSRWRFLSFDERYDIAWFAIAEQIYACDEEPSSRGLVDHGEKAIRHHVDSLSSYHGVHYAGHSSGIEPGTPMPRFATYWLWLAAPTPSPEARVVDELALQQIWSRLTRTHQSVLLALAVHGDYQRAAVALDKTYRTFVSQIHAARKHFYRLWHQHETPTGVWGHDRRKRANPPTHTITQTTVRRRRARAKARQGNDHQDGGQGGG